MARERQFCNIEPYCVLCRDTILYPEDSKPADLENWQQTAVGFCLPINSSNPVQFYVFRVDLRDGEWPRPSELLSSLQAIQDVRVRVTSDSGPKWPRNPAGSISLLHAVCYQLAYKRYTTETIKVLSALARRTYPLMAWPITFDTGKSRPDFHLGTVPMAVINSDTSLGRFLSEINRRLPFEVQNIVFGHLSGFAHCLGKTLLALDWASSPSTAIFLPARPFSEKPFEEPSVSEIGAIKTKVLGETCLARIGADDRSDDTSSLIFVNKRVTKVQISFGMYGVVGFRAMYADNSVSSWLGGPGQWCVTYECQDLTSLNIISDVGFPLIPKPTTSPFTRHLSFFNWQCMSLLTVCLQLLTVSPGLQDCTSRSRR